jgi:hypothetical protein
MDIQALKTFPQGLKPNFFTAPGGTAEAVPFQSYETVYSSSHPAVPAATGEIARKCSTASGTTFKT